MQDIAPGRIKLSVDEAHDLSMCALRGLGYDDTDAGLITDHVLDAALCGYEYSGLAKILNVAADPRLKKPRTPPAVIQETPVSIQMDGGNNNGMVAMFHAAEAAIGKARESGIGLVSLSNSWMSGRHAYFAEHIARADLIGIQLESTRSPSVAPPGARQGALGTNPIAFGIPTADGPFVFDMGTAALMSTDLALRVLTGQSLPEGVAIDPDGMPTQDPVAAKAGALLTFGGYKGFGLSLVVQLFGVLAGCVAPSERPHGAVIIAFRPDLVAPLDVFKQQATAMVDSVRATPAQAGMDSIRLPSERAFASRELLTNEGIEIDKLVYDALLAF
jgi:LDH2 family malate/lactate/ureidoglycolate dehydrogenase